MEDLQMTRIYYPKPGDIITIDNKKQLYQVYLANRNEVYCHEYPHKSSTVPILWAIKLKEHVIHALLSPVDPDREAKESARNKIESEKLYYYEGQRWYIINEEIEKHSTTFGQSYTYIPTYYDCKRYLLYNGESILDITIDLKGENTIHYATDCIIPSVDNLLRSVNIVLNEDED